MAEKRPISNLRFAISYVLGVIIVAGAISKIISALIESLGIELEAMIPLLNYGINFIIWIFSVWLGVVVICWYLNKTFRIEDKQKVLNSAVIFFIVLYVIVLGVLILALMLLEAPYAKISGLYFVDVIVQLLISTTLIYFFGKKYIKGPAEGEMGISGT